MFTTTYPSQEAPESHSRLRRFTKCFTEQTSGLVHTEISDVTSKNAEGQSFLSDEDGRLCVLHLVTHPQTSVVWSCRAGELGENGAFKLH